MRKWIKRKFRSTETADRSHEWWQANHPREKRKQRPKSAPLKRSLAELRLPRVESTDYFLVNLKTARHIAEFVGQRREQDSDDWYLLNFVLNAAQAGFREFTIPKRNGQPRVISEPLGTRKKFLKLFYQALITHPLVQEIIPENAFGFIPGRDIIDNALFHFGEGFDPEAKIAVVKIDLKSAFDNIPLRHDYRASEAKCSTGQYQLSLEELLWKLGFHLEEAELMLHLLTWNNRVPQGSPVSPLLLVLTTSGLIQDLTEICAKFGCVVTIYADDITISKKGVEIPKPLINRVIRIIRGYFPINYEKLRWYRLGEVPHITGLTYINGRLEVRRDVKEGFRLRVKNFIRDIRSGRKDPEKYDHVVHGMVAYLVSVYGSFDQIPRRLRLVFGEFAQARFQALLTPKPRPL